MTGPAAEPSGELPASGRSRPCRADECASGCLRGCCAAVRYKLPAALLESERLAQGIVHRQGALSAGCPGRCGHRCSAREEVGSMVGEAWEEPVYADLIDALAAFRSEQLGHLPSDRALAEAARVSPTTVGHWLRGDRFPQEIDPLLRLVRAVQAQAERVQCADSPVAAAVFDQHRWRRAFRDEAVGGLRQPVTRCRQGRAGRFSSRCGRADR